MIYLNIHEAKTHLSSYLTRLEEGEVIVLCRRNVPIAEIRALPHPQQRSIGFAAGEFHVPDDFNAALPDSLLEAFSNPQ